MTAVGIVAALVAAEVAAFGSVVDDLARLVGAALAEMRGTER